MFQISIKKNNENLVNIYPPYKSLTDVIVELLQRGESVKLIAIKSNREHYVTLGKNYDVYLSENNIYIINDSNTRLTCYDFLANPIREAVLIDFFYSHFALSTSDFIWNRIELLTYDNKKCIDTIKQFITSHDLQARGAKIITDIIEGKTYLFLYIEPLHIHKLLNKLLMSYYDRKELDDLILLNIDLAKFPIYAS